MQKTTLLVVLTVICLALLSSFNTARAQESRIRPVTGAFVLLKIYDESGKSDKSVPCMVGEGISITYPFRPREHANPNRPIEIIFIDYQAKIFYKMLTDGSDTVTTRCKFNYISEGKPQQEKIEGWECKAVKVKYRGDSYQIWYTRDLGYNGTPWPELGIPDGLVLRVIRNGRPFAEPTYITQHSDRLEFPASWGKMVSASKYKKARKELPDQSLSRFK